MCDFARYMHVLVYTQAKIVVASRVQKNKTEKNATEYKDIQSARKAIAGQALRAFYLLLLIAFSH